MSNNEYSDEEKQLFEQYAEETGKQAIWKGKLTKAFKDWRESLLEVEEEEEEVIEGEEVKEAVKETIIEAATEEIKRLEELEQLYRDFEAKFNELKEIHIPTEDDFEFKVEQTQAKKIQFYLRVMTTALRKSFARIETLKKKEQHKIKKVQK